MAQRLAYSHAVQSSPGKERFGKGAVEGVLGPGAANTSKEGGNLILTVAFGVPASVSMAILLGAFLIQGIQPGPDMLTKHLSLTFSMVWIIVIANIITVVLSLLFINQLVKITQVRGSLIIPFILFLVFFGAYAEKNTLFDLGLVLVFGALGWIMVQTDWPRPPLILGLVLGRLTERYLFLSVNRYEAEWLLRPLVMLFAAGIIAVLVYSVLQQIRRPAAGAGVIEDLGLAERFAPAAAAVASVPMADGAGAAASDGARAPVPDADGADGRAETALPRARSDSP